MALDVRHLGRVRYADALALQNQLREARAEGRVPDTVLLLEHPDVITFGRGSREGNALLSDDELRAAGYEVFRVNRGGDVTWHGPGQLVGYPIFDLAGRGSDVLAYLRALEGVLIESLAGFGLPALRRPGFTGVWLDERRKIASIGVGVRRWLTMHGFALYVCCDLTRFEPILPCGLEGVEMTSMATALRGDIGLEEVARAVESELRKAFP